MKALEEINTLVKTTPNDADLGGKIRSLVNSIESNKNSFIQCVSCGIWQSLMNHNCKHCKNEL
jgi:hypothetical protein